MAPETIMVTSDSGERPLKDPGAGARQSAVPVWHIAQYCLSAAGPPGDCAKTGRIRFVLRNCIKSVKARYNSFWWEHYFAGAAKGTVPANTQHRKNTNGASTINCKIP